MTLSGMYLNVSSLIFYRSIYSPYDPFLATSLAQVQANGLSAAALAAAGGNPAGLDPRLQVRGKTIILFWITHPRMRYPKENDIYLQLLLVLLVYYVSSSIVNSIVGDLPNSMKLSKTEI